MTKKLETKARGRIMSSLETKKCSPCDEETEPLTDQQEYDYLNRIHGWSLNRKQVHQLRKLFQFASFAEAVEFVNQVAKVAEEENHHPDIYLAYRHVTVILWTKKISGLSENDFILAAKIDQLPLPN
jgi:4a-hydroxytetrahydrobiopterin dehydratase